MCRSCKYSMTDEAIDEALTSRNKVVIQNESVSSLSFQTCKNLRHSITIRAQNFSSSIWDRFYGFAF